MDGNETQPCMNCGCQIGFDVHRGCWVHVGGMRFRQCLLYATPTTPIEGVDF